MSTPISLIQMPNLVLEHILEYLEFPSILVLRKVCHDLRNFIDETKPASHLTRINVIVKLECIHFLVSFKSFSSIEKSWYIDYKENGEGCLVKCRKVDKYNEIIVENEDFVTVFCKNFDIYLRHQKTVLEEFGVTFILLNLAVKQKILAGVTESLKSLNHLLQVKKIEMEISCHKDIMSILPYVDSKSMKTIEINDVWSQNHVMNLNEIGQLEQWKQAEELTIRGFQITDLAQNVKHFSRVTLRFQDLSTEELILLNEIFLCSSTLNTIEIYNRIKCTEVIRSRLIEAFGPHSVGADQDTNWFFRIPDTNQLLRIIQKGFDIHFDRIKQSDVPKNAGISN